jgi:lysophospholipase L1-like esterase
VRAVSTLYPLLEPFWLSTTMHRESVMFVAAADNAAEATLLFRPDEILSVNDAAREVSYIEETDYRIDAETRRIIRPPWSRMTCVSPETAKAPNGALRHKWLVAVTYTHHDRWQGFVPEDAAAQLPRVTRRLEQREPLTICLTGDSISEGYDASGFHHMRPDQPPFGPLVAAGLQQQSGAKVQFHNFATAGWTTEDALWDTERIASVHPDLVVVAFGMNDASYASADEYAANVSRLLARIREAATDTEFILVSPMLPAPECDWLVHSRFGEYRNALGELNDQGVVLADVTTLWSELVARKDPHDLSGNGWNHPNDFGHRVYAQTVLTVMGYGALSRIRSPR